MAFIISDTLHWKILLNLNDVEVHELPLGFQLSLRLTPEGGSYKAELRHALECYSAPAATLLEAEKVAWDMLYMRLREKPMMLAPTSIRNCFWYDGFPGVDGAG